MSAKLFTATTIGRDRPWQQGVTGKDNSWQRASSAGTTPGSAAPRSNALRCAAHA